MYIIVLWVENEMTFCDTAIIWLSDYIPLLQTKLSKGNINWIKFRMSIVKHFFATYRHGGNLM